MTRLFLWLLLAGLALAQAPTLLTSADNHKTVQVDTGQKLQLRLPTNPTQGFAWQLHYKNSQLKPVGKPVYVATDKKKPKLGGSVTYTWNVAGEFEDGLELRYVKGEKPKPVRTFLVHLRTAAPSP